MRFDAIALNLKPSTSNIKLSTSNSKWRCLHGTAPFFTIFYITYIKSLHLLGRIRLYSESGTSQIRLFKGEDFL